MMGNPGSLVPPGANGLRSWDCALEQSKGEETRLRKKAFFSYLELICDCVQGHDLWVDRDCPRHGGGEERRLLEGGRARHFWWRGRREAKSEERLMDV